MTIELEDDLLKVYVMKTTCSRFVQDLDDLLKVYVTRELEDDVLQVYVTRLAPGLQNSICSHTSFVFYQT